MCNLLLTIEEAGTDNIPANQSDRIITNITSFAVALIRRFLRNVTTLVENQVGRVLEHAAEKIHARLDVTLMLVQTALIAFTILGVSEAICCLVNRFQNFNGNAAGRRSNDIFLERLNKTHVILKMDAANHKDENFRPRKAQDIGNEIIEDLKKFMAKPEVASLAWVNLREKENSLSRRLKPLHAAYIHMFRLGSIKQQSVRGLAFLHQPRLPPLPAPPRRETKPAGIYTFSALRGPTSRSQSRQIGLPRTLRRVW